MEKPYIINRFEMEKRNKKRIGKKNQKKIWSLRAGASITPARTPGLQK